ncbi:Uncharacterised protein [Mycobacteroides abscessus subsp. abscessus]|nr:Uncharacterised protein [Mycobacteroides abscessus subsp. abscessus]
MTWQASSKRSNRSVNEPSSMPYAWDSSSFQPAPRPSSRRPPETMSAVAAILARMAGCR